MNRQYDLLTNYYFTNRVNGFVIPPMCVENEQCAYCGKVLYRTENNFFFFCTGNCEQLKTHELVYYDPS